MSNASEMNRLNRAVMSAFELSDVNTETEMNGGGNHNDEISEFITKLSDFYTKKSETNNVSGGYNGSRNIRSESTHNIFGGKKDDSSDSESSESSSESSSLMGSSSDTLDLGSSSSSSSDDKHKKKSQSHLTSTLDRVRNPEADEKYRAFVKTIMDLLNVDEDTARLYRSAIKITIERKNPELRKDELLKIKEMENIFESESSLKATLKKIDIDEIKKHMAMQKQKSEERRKEFGQSTTENKKPVSTKKNDDAETPKDKKKKQKRVNAARVASNGYLVSSEFILSSE